jgi:hypothetical protein
MAGTAKQRTCPSCGDTYSARRPRCPQCGERNDLLAESGRGARGTGFWLLDLMMAGQDLDPAVRRVLFRAGALLLIGAVVVGLVLLRMLSR